ncbi:MAG: hypothetical protein CSA20_02505 [Deltaproteobacteria bacterium]|nr:MAG: hypothetical protein CSA20_02505 [Deltaproteobacteria bacterium]
MGWAILGTAGYLAYRAGKKAGRNQEENIEQTSLCDRAVKETMKAAYKAKIKVDDSLRSTKQKYAGMWDEAQSEVVSN